MSDIRNMRIRCWTLAGIWTAVIYSTLYIMRPVCEFYKKFAWYSFSLNAGMVLVVAVLVIFSVKAKYIQKPSTYLLLILVLTGYFYGIIMLPIPEERLHFIEYGVLAFLVYRALILDLNNSQAYLVAFFITSLIGWGDEGIQYILPNRYYDFRDVCLNSIGAALGLAFVYIIHRDKRLKQASNAP